MMPISGAKSVALGVSPSPLLSLMNTRGWMCHSTSVISSTSSIISVAPGAHFTIEFRAQQTAGHARVALTDAADVSVTAAAGAANYTAAADRLEIDNRGGSASFDVALPRRAPRIDVVVAGRRVLTKIGGSVSGAGATVEGGRYVISLEAAP